MATNFDTLLVGYWGEGWPSLTREQAEFLITCPTNKRGWHYYQIPSGPTVHFKTGLDFRNPSVPYQIVRVGGLQVFGRIGYPGDGKVIIGRTGDRIWAQKEYARIWFPADGDWNPAFGAWEFYRQYFSPDYYVQKEITHKERVIFWAAMRATKDNIGEDYYRRQIETYRRWVFLAADGKGGVMDLESSMNYLQSGMAAYVKFMGTIKSKVDLVF